MGLQKDDGSLNVKSQNKLIQYNTLCSVALAWFIAIN